MSRPETHQMALDLAEFLCGAVRRDAEWMDLVTKNRQLRTENTEARRLLKECIDQVPPVDEHAYERIRAFLGVDDG